jgi:hypothetical protein
MQRKQGGLFRLPRRFALLVPQLDEVAPQVAFPVEVNEAGRAGTHG